jgi:hypothetical protein
MLNSIVWIEHLAAFEPTQLNGAQTLCSSQKLHHFAYKPESKGKSAKEHMRLYAHPPATFRPMDDTVAYEPSADCQLPMYNAAR